MQAAISTLIVSNRAAVCEIIAATAVEHNAVLLHYDRDFEAIAEITGQAQEWVAPAGSIN